MYEQAISSCKLTEHCVRYLKTYCHSYNKNP